MTLPSHAGIVVIGGGIMLFDGYFGARPQGRCRAAGTGQADLGLDLACGGTGRAVALVGFDHARAQIFGRTLQGAGGRNRSRNRLEDDRVPQAGHQCRPLDRIQAVGDDGEKLRHGHAIAVAGRGQGDVAAARNRRSRRGFLAADGRPGKPVRHHAVAGQGRTHAWCETARGCPRHRLRDEGRPHHRGEDQQGRYCLRQSGELRRAMGKASGRHGRHQRALQPVKHQYIITEKIEGWRPTRRPSATPTAALFQRESRRAGDGSYRPNPQAGRLGTFERLEFACSTTTTIIRAA